MTYIVSVVIPLYNKEPHIKRAIDSVLAQKIQNFEIIVIDDGSTDKGAELVKNFRDQRIRLIQQENAGVSAARNKGIEEAKTDLIAFLDADDEWTPDFLETVLRLREEYPEAGAYAASYQKSKGGKIKIANIRGLPPSPWKGLLPDYFMSTAFGDHPICSSAVCVPKYVLLEIGTFKVGVKWGEDDDLWGRIALKYPIAFSWNTGAIYNKDATNRACYSSDPIEKHPFVKSVRTASNGYSEYVNLVSLKECIAKFQILAAKQNIHNGYNKLARKNLKKCETEIFYNEKLFWYFISILPRYVYLRMVDVLLRIRNIEKV